ncbi:MAG TPA: hypothetical protein VN844_19015, partial [Pyrinomonadaceae bacterium]|nr:hypothetical protein [Pyrinomonadaceae bacterium]
VDVEAEAERREAIERFWGFVSRLDKVTQKIMHCHLRDYSLKEIQAKLATEEIQLSHVAIGNLVRKVMADFLASEDGHIATLIARKGKYLSRDRERDDLSARKSGS